MLYLNQDKGLVNKVFILYKQTAKRIENTVDTNKRSVRVHKKGQVVFMKKFMRENLKFICLALIILAGSFAIRTNVKKAGAATRKCYTINTSNTRVYSNTGLTRGYGWIYPTDQVTVITVTGRYSKVSYPAGNRTKTGYISTGAILTATGGTTYTSRGKFNTYKRDGGSYYGYVSANDRVMVLGTRGGYTQIKYPVSGGFKYAFATTSDVNNYLKGEAGNNNVNNNGNSNNNTTQTNTGTYSISGNLLTVNGVAMTDYRIGGKYTNSYYAKVNGKKVYMAGSQCCGYARYIAYKLYGCHDKSAPGKFKDVSGRVAPGKLTAQKMKAAVTAAGVGAHIRTSNRIGQSKHSMSIIAVTDSGFTVTDANSDGKNTIKVTTYTWSSYVSSKYGKRGLCYIKKYVG